MYNKVIGFENYSVSRNGEVRNDKTGRILKQHTRKGYYRVSLRGNKESKKHTVHRLVAEAFIDNLHSKKFINHKDGNKLNNNVDNLEWVTASENLLHAMRTGLHKQTHRLKFSIDEMSEICEAFDTGLFSMRELARVLKTTHNTISGIVNRRTANGFQ